MKHTLQNHISQKHTFNYYLQKSVDILEEDSTELFLKLYKKHKKRFPNSSESFFANHGSNNFIENLTSHYNSLHEKIQEQIKPPYFPTPLSQKVALEILYDLTSDGFFDGDINSIAKSCECEEEFVQSIRRRFMKFIEPVGMGAVSISESLLMQLEDIENEDKEVLMLAREMVQNLKKITKYQNDPRYEKASRIIKKLNFAPSIDFLPNNLEKIADFTIEIRSKEIEIKPNHILYNDFLLTSLEEKSLQSTLKKRERTLEQIIGFIAHFQKDFFDTKILKPLLLEDIATFLGYHKSTISRAIANKYVATPVGLILIKDLLARPSSNPKISINEIKKFISLLMKNEDKTAPLSDESIKKEVNNKFNTNLTTRSVSYYRVTLGYGNSYERKKVGK